MRELHYGRVAPFYDLLGTVWTGGRIRASKLSQIDEIQRGDKVLYVGCGTGEDALAAAKKGADVVVVELAPQMLERTRRRFNNANAAAEFICGNAWDHVRPDGYDAVVANFFLNIFEPDVMPRMVRHLGALVRPGGKMFIADFAPLSGGFFSRLGAQIHHGVPVLAFAVTTNQPIHPIYDYQPVLREVRFSRQSVRNFGPWMISIAAAR
jgi:ubiquinone/menaquinone biosynthesis C-methylase UbiE